jgi:hypothetical protein
VFSVFIEQTQNIKNYCGHKATSPYLERIANSGIVAIGKTDQGHYVSAGNLIEVADAPKFAAQLDIIVTMDKPALKQYYKQQLKADVPPGSNSAGLGLIDMARKASLPLEYSIQKIDQAVCFFTLKAYV